MELKTFVLLDHMDSNAPVYQRVDKDSRVKLKKIPVHRPFLQVTFSKEEKEPDGQVLHKTKTIRYKERSNSIFQDVQIKNEGIPANDRFTTNERNAPRFNNGVLHTNKPILYEFLKAHPENETFDGICTEVVKKTFKEYVPGDIIKNKNADFKKRIEVGNKIATLSLQQGQDMLIRINGSYFPVPDTLEEVQNKLVEFMDETDSEGLEQILKSDLTVDEQATVLIGNAIKAKLISFDAVTGQVSKVKGDKFVKLKDIPTDLDQAQQEKYFADFLTTEAGISLYKDLEKELEKQNSKQK